MEHTSPARKRKDSRSCRSAGFGHGLRGKPDRCCISTCSIDKSISNKLGMSNLISVSSCFIISAGKCVIGIYRTALHFIQRPESASLKFYNADFKMVMVFIVCVDIPVSTMTGKMLIHPGKYVLTLPNIVFVLVPVIKYVCTIT